MWTASAWMRSPRCSTATTAATRASGVPNHLGGRENFESIDFLRDLSRAVEHRCPGAVLIAEESTAFPDVSRPADQGGLGFHYKWNMGWMHDTLHYMAEEPVYRQWHHGEILFGLVYAFSERFVLPLSHDEVVYGKGSLIRKMPGDDWQRFANLRAYFGFMWSYPGKKLLFMGCEFAQWAEWNHDQGLDWFLLDDPRNKGVQHLVQELNRAYRDVPALHARDTESDGFRWVVMDDAGPERVRLPSPGPAGRSAGADGVQLHAGAAAWLPDRGADPGDMAGADQHRRRKLRRIQCGKFRAGPRRRRSPLTVSNIP